MKPRRRWIRLISPLAVVLAVIAGVVTVRLLAEPDTSEPHYLSPQDGPAEPTSAKDLVDRLRAKGITVRRETRSSDALMATWAAKGQVTLFIPAPEYVHIDYLWMLRQSPAATRIVLVEPNARQLSQALPPVGVGATRWATAVTSRGAGCELTGAGPAAVTRTRYAQFVGARSEGGTMHACYENGLVSFKFRDIDFVLAGSADPFRSDRIAEHDNARLAVDLLSTKPTVVWLDLHAAEPKPKSFSEDKGNGQPVPSLQPGNQRERPDASPRPRTTFEFEEPEEEEEEVAAAPPDPFPDWLPVLILLLLLAGVVLAIARGRRLGPPVTEPLPINVRGAETAIGRSNLYRRAKARGAALETLRIEARRRLAEVLRTGPDRDRLVDAVAQRSAYPREMVFEILYGSEPEDDATLQTRTTELLQLVQQVTRETP